MYFSTNILTASLPLVQKLARSTTETRVRIFELIVKNPFSTAVAVMSFELQTLTIPI